MNRLQAPEIHKEGIRMLDKVKEAKIARQTLAPLANLAAQHQQLLEQLLNQLQE